MSTPKVSPYLIVVYVAVSGTLLIAAEHFAPRVLDSLVQLVMIAAPVVFLIAQGRTIEQKADANAETLGEVKEAVNGGLTTRIKAAVNEALDERLPPA